MSQAERLGVGAGAVTLLPAAAPASNLPVPLTSVVPSLNLTPGPVAPVCPVTWLSGFIVGTLAARYAPGLSILFWRMALR